ncbi:MAG: ATP-binding protein [Propionivibrio sp.]|mgnify:FL=1
MSASLERLLPFIVDRIEVGIFALDKGCNVVLWNSFMATHSGHAADEVIGRNLFDCFPDLPRQWLSRKIESVFVLKNYAFTSWEQRPYVFRFDHNRPITGGVDAMRQSCILLPLKDAAGEVEFVCVTLIDFTDTAMFQGRLNAAIVELEQEKTTQKELIHKLEDAQGQLLQSEKMASVGQLAAGVAHEINNPIAFINSNLGTLKKQAVELLGLIDAYERLEPAGASDAAALDTVRAIKQSIDLDFLREDIVNLIDESLEGARRVKAIVDNLKDFSRVDTAEWHWANLEQGLESTLSIVWNELKYKCEVVREYAGIPEVECIASQINQVFMNIIVNAGQAIAEHGTIHLRTGRGEKTVWVEIEDSGEGIRAEHLARIFEPFFTTKPVGKGTGLGLSLAYGIVQRHGGLLEVQSEVGRGTRFRMTLPVQREGGL